MIKEICSRLGRKRKEEGRLRGTYGHVLTDESTQSQRGIFLEREIEVVLLVEICCGGGVDSGG